MQLGRQVRLRRCGCGLGQHMHVCLHQPGQPMAVETVNSTSEWWFGIILHSLTEGLTDPYPPLSWERSYGGGGGGGARPGAVCTSSFVSFLFLPFLTKGKIQAKFLQNAHKLNTTFPFWGGTIMFCQNKTFTLWYFTVTQYSEILYWLPLLIGSQGAWIISLTGTGDRHGFSGPCWLWNILDVMSLAFESPLDAVV